MQNEFEKQVQQKMVELRLVPSTPVWEKVEMQIRKKKDRRRLLFWMPLFALIGTGLWVGINRYSNGEAYKTNNNTQNKDSHILPEPNKNSSEQNDQIVIGKSQSKNEITPDINNVKRIDKKLDLRIAQNSFSKDVKTENIISFPDNKPIKPSIDEIVFDENTTINETPQLMQQILIPTDTSLKIIQNSDSGAMHKINEVKLPSEPESIKVDSSFKNIPGAKKHAVSNLKFNLIVSAGTSGLGRVNFYNGQKSLAGYNAPAGSSNSGGSIFYYGPSEVQKSFSYSAGVSATKQLTKRTFFFTALRYNYYSNTIHVGSQVNQNRTIMDFAVTQFYSNQSNILKPYKNRYQFISVPVAIDWQMLKKTPLNFSTGLSFQYLVETNALRFDYNTQSYFHNIKAFNRAQVFSEFALTYSVPLKQKPLTFGPQIQYGLTQLEKGNPDHHIFSYGLKAQWQFKK